MELIGVLIGALTAISIFIAVKKRYWDSRPATKAKRPDGPAPDVATLSGDPLKHSDWRVRLQAIETYASDAQNHLSALSRALDDTDPDVRTAAKDALINLGAPAVPELCRVLQEGTLEGQRTAADALGAIGHDDGVSDLIAALHNDSLYVRTAAAQALGNIGHKAAVDGLIVALNDADNEVRQNAADALRKIGTNTAKKAIAKARL